MVLCNLCHFLQCLQWQCKAPKQVPQSCEQRKPAAKSSLGEHGCVSGCLLGLTQHRIMHPTVPINVPKIVLRFFWFLSLVTRCAYFCLLAQVVICQGSVESPGFLEVTFLSGKLVVMHFVSEAYTSTVCSPVQETNFQKLRDILKCDSIQACFAVVFKQGISWADIGSAENQPCRSFSYT